jgi:hypothetical protein
MSIVASTATVPTTWAEVHEAIERLDPEAQVRAAIWAAELSAGPADPISLETLRALIEWKATGRIPEHLHDLAEKAYRARRGVGHHSVERSASLCISHAAWSLWFLSALADPRRREKVLAATRDSVSHALAVHRVRERWPAAFVKAWWGPQPP